MARNKFRPCRQAVPSFVAIVSTENGVCCERIPVGKAYENGLILKSLPADRDYPLKKGAVACRHGPFWVEVTCPHVNLRKVKSWKYAINKACLHKNARFLAIGPENMANGDRLMVAHFQLSLEKALDFARSWGSDARIIGL